MRSTEECTAWVVYRMTLFGDTVGGNVVCEQREWDEIERIRPGFHLLIRAEIGTEQEAEKLARGTAGDPKPPKTWQQKQTDRLRREALAAILRSQTRG